MDTPHSPHNERVCKADWIASRLFVPHHALRRIAGVEPYSDDGYAFAMGAASLLTRTVGFPFDQSGDEAASAYNSWLFNRFLQERFALEPKLLIQTVAYLQEALEQIAPKDLGTDEARLKAAGIQKYFLRLPTQIRQAITPNSDLLNRIGVVSQSRVGVAELQFEKVQYLTAAMGAINGRKGEVKLIDTDLVIVFFPTEPAGNGFQFEHPKLHK